jgi:hypothetical protein
MHGYSSGRDAAVVISSREPAGSDDSLPPPRKSAVNKQDAFAASCASEVCVDSVRHGRATLAGEGDHELVGSQHVAHALSLVVCCASLQPADLPASTKKSGRERG